MARIYKTTLSVLILLCSIDIDGAGQLCACDFAFQGTGRLRTSRAQPNQPDQRRLCRPLATYLVSATSVDPSIATDTDVLSFEADHALDVSELSGTTQGTLLQSATSVLDLLPGRAPVTYFGSTVANYYVSQPASTLTRLGSVQGETSLTGAGIVVAVIDTGVDPNHPALTGVLVPGFDFVHNTAGGSELVDLSADQLASLSQSNTSILDGQNLVQLNSFTMAVLSQSNTSILDGGPKSFGHGTMTAGLVHLIAPNAKIMPLKAFTADGGSDLFNILSRHSVCSR